MTRGRRLRAVRNRTSIPGCGRNGRVGHLSMTAWRAAGVAAACTIFNAPTWTHPRRSHKVAARHVRHASSPPLAFPRSRPVLMTVSRASFVAHHVGDGLALAGGTGAGAGLSVSPGQDDRAVRRRRSDRYFHPLRSPRSCARRSSEPFVMENRPGAGTIIGTEAAAKSPPDGYTLLMISATQTTTETLVPNKSYKLLRDFVPVASLLNSELVHGRAPLGAGEHGRGIHRARQGEARRAQLCLLGSRLELSHGRRAF